jgi:hypothetical protein
MGWMTVHPMVMAGYYSPLVMCKMIIHPSVDELDDYSPLVMGWMTVHPLIMG